MLTPSEIERICRLPLDPQMFSREDWDDLERRLASVLKEEEVLSSRQESSSVSTSPQNGENVP